MSETAAQPALKPRGAARDRLVRRGRIAGRAREESDDSADEADDATGASEAGQGEDAPKGGRELGRIRLRPALGPKALISHDSAKE